ncbi:UMUC domain-containing protein DNA-repair protein [Oceanococcus atlanticus]|uniref:UMUC domain-containing protein DNA-repair protein n=1 Tax=Oceanococcus atlanticus TaxID=1317117 RepID=A0A1Y1SIE5_9GAMM|nr:Y-family DNA polymerase [Oceanococcus atlanticus]ORE89445.1 UMUC domain-containing protein DNA-repair protein [Oceanococcus atlanticus]
MGSAASSERRIALVDVNNFYASCETVFNPKLRGKPVVVLSNNDGCVVARSAEAKALNIKMAQPWHQVDPTVQRQTAVFSSNYTLYADISNRVMTILGDMAPSQEVYSIDESFLELTGIRELRQHAHAIRQRVSQWTGLTVCVGVGTTKTRAKLANYVAKKSPEHAGVFNLETLSAIDQSALLAKIPVGDVWGIGFRTERRLVQMGIRTAADLRRSRPKQLRQQFGVVAERIVAELNGEVCTELEISPPAKQQIRLSRSFGAAVSELPLLKEAMLAFVSIAAEKLRRQNSFTSTLQVFVCTNVFRPDKPQHSTGFTLKLPYAMDDTAMLAKFAVRALEHLYKPGYEYKKAGVNLMSLSPRGNAQLELFTNDRIAKRGDQLSTAMDNINRRFGRESICLGRLSGPRPWSMNQTRLSPAYTTNMNQLLLAR